MKKGYFVWKKPFIDAMGAACHMWLVVGLLRYTDEKCTVHRLELIHITLNPKGTLSMAFAPSSLYSRYGTF